MDVLVYARTGIVTKMSLAQYKITCDDIVSRHLIYIAIP